MKIDGKIPGFDISAKGMSIQRKKMNLIAENIANADSMRDENGMPYQKKFLQVTENQNPAFTNSLPSEASLTLVSTKNGHIVNPTNLSFDSPESTLNFNELQDNSQGDIVYMPDHPDADKEGYVQMSNVNVITEMTDMIAATRSYEANLTAFNASKQIVKDTLEI